MWQSRQDTLVLCAPPAAAMSAGGLVWHLAQSRLASSEEGEFGCPGATGEADDQGEYCGKMSYGFHYSSFKDIQIKSVPIIDKIRRGLQ